MNPQLTMALADSHRQDLQRAAKASRDAAGLSTGSNLTARLRETISRIWSSHPAASQPSQSSRGPVVSGL